MTRSGGPAPPAPPAPLDDAVREVLRRVARRSVAWWRTATPEGRTRAAAVGDLVAVLATAAQRVELGEVRHGTPPPPRREDVLVDQLAVVAYDLRLALAAAGGRHAETAAATARCLLVAYEVDPRPLPASLVERALRSGVADRGLVERLPLLRDA